MLQQSNTFCFLAHWGRRFCKFTRFLFRDKVFFVSNATINTSHECKNNRWGEKIQNLKMKHMDCISVQLQILVWIFCVFSLRLAAVYVKFKASTLTNKPQHSHGRPQPVNRGRFGSVSTHKHKRVCVSWWLTSGSHHEEFMFSSHNHTTKQTNVYDTFDDF